MPNPATAAILERLDRPDLLPFISAWDDFEALVIRVFRAKAVTAADSAEFADIHTRLHSEYPRWQTDLASFTAKVAVRGQPLTSDPFAQLLAPQTLAAFLEDWALIQLLPAAREALNLYLISLSDTRTGS